MKDKVMKYEIYQAAKIMLPAAQHELTQAKANLKALQRIQWQGGLKGWWAMRKPIREARAVVRVCGKKVARFERTIWEWE